MPSLIYKMIKDFLGNEMIRDIYGNPLKKRENKREPVSQSQKNEVLARQKNRCARCKNPLDMRAKHFDHVKEVYKGGKSRIGNLQALCPNCHSKKTHKEKLQKVEKRRKTNKSSGNYFVNPLTGKKEKNNNIWKL